VGVPAGGTAGQVLAKVDGDDYNTEWVDQTGSGTTITVSEIDASSNITNQVTSVSTIRFDRDTGFNVEDLGSGEVKVSLGSSWKTWQVDGQESLVAVGEDTVTFVAGNNMIISTDANAKTITFDSTIAIPDPVTSSETAPNTGVLWFNSTEARMYVKYNEQWVDASPTVLAPPDTNPTLESVTFNDNTTQTTAWTGTVSYRNITDVPEPFTMPAFVGGGGAATWLTPD
jgi:hypothetical protein